MKKPLITVLSFVVLMSFGILLGAGSARAEVEKSKSTGFGTIGNLDQAFEKAKKAAKKPSVKVDQDYIQDLRHRFFHGSTDPLARTWETGTVPSVDEEMTWSEKVAEMLPFMKFQNPEWEDTGEEVPEGFEDGPYVKNEKDAWLNQGLSKKMLEWIEEIDRWVDQQHQAGNVGGSSIVGQFVSLWSKGPCSLRASMMTSANTATSAKGGNKSKYPGIKHNPRGVEVVKWLIPNAYNFRTAYIKGGHEQDDRAPDRGGHTGLAHGDPGHIFTFTVDGVEGTSDARGAAKSAVQAAKLAKNATDTDIFIPVYTDPNTPPQNNLKFSWLTAREFVKRIKEGRVDDAFINEAFLYGKGIFPWGI